MRSDVLWLAELTSTFWMYYRPVARVPKQEERYVTLLFTLATVYIVRSTSYSVKYVLYTTVLWWNSPRKDHHVETGTTALLHCQTVVRQTYSTYALTELLQRSCDKPKGYREHKYIVRTKSHSRPKTLWSLLGERGKSCHKMKVYSVSLHGTHEEIPCSYIRSGSSLLIVTAHATTSRQQSAY